MGLSCVGVEIHTVLMKKGFPRGLRSQGSRAKNAMARAKSSSLSKASRRSKRLADGVRCMDYLGRNPSSCEIRHL